ncbi:MAG: UDP-N-acetylmuramoyl-L-alanyl-D-glutamate--2,6-diaminopimelate ligase, partial [Tissierellia bacterium]|nr:UDP-N-acetylmuramoyl-L-alanyl-D-glutamate--2,6-diaminopimelate ligase [Tissierellia bacterium]
MKLSKMMSKVKRTGWEITEDPDVLGITDDSREVVKGGVFVAAPGHTVDGHDYIGNAIEAGAKVIVHEKPVDLPEGIVSIEVEDSFVALGQMSYEFFEKPDENMVMIGITGTNGKTSSTYFIGSILQAHGKKVGIIGTNGAMILDRHKELPNTTPFPLLLHETLAEMVNAGCEYCVMEVSSHAMTLGRVANIHFDYVLFTNLTQDHLDFHGDMESYFQAKKSLFPLVKKLAYINTDDEYGIRLIDELQDSIDVKTYGIDKKGDITASNIQYRLNGASYDLHLPQGNMHLNINTPGKFSIYNTMMSAALCAEMGVPLDVIAKGLKEMKGVKGRFQVVYTNTDYHVIIDFAHTSDSLEKILQTIREFKTGRLVVIFGAGGDRDRTKRPIMGRVAGEYADFCIVTSDNPRSEVPERIIEDIVAGLEPVNQNFVTITDRKEAIHYAIDNAQPEDIIVLAG